MQILVKAHTKQNTLEVFAMRLLLIAVLLISGCSTHAGRTFDTRWSDRNYQIMVLCGEKYSDDADYAECLLLNNAII